MDTASYDRGLDPAFQMTELEDHLCASPNIDNIWSLTSCSNEGCAGQSQMLQTTSTDDSRYNAGEASPRYKCATDATSRTSDPALLDDSSMPMADLDYWRPPISEAGSAAKMHSLDSRLGSTTLPQLGSYASISNMVDEYTPKSVPTDMGHGSPPWSIDQTHFLSSSIDDIDFYPTSLMMQSQKNIHRASHQSPPARNSGGRSRSLPIRAQRTQVLSSTRRTPLRKELPPSGEQTAPGTAPSIRGTWNTTRLGRKAQPLRPFRTYQPTPFLAPYSSESRLNFLALRGFEGPTNVPAAIDWKNHLDGTIPACSSYMIPKSYMRSAPDIHASDLSYAEPLVNWSVVPLGSNRTDELPDEIVGSVFTPDSTPSTVSSMPTLAPSLTDWGDATNELPDTLLLTPGYSSRDDSPSVCNGSFPSEYLTMDQCTSLLLDPSTGGQMYLEGYQYPSQAATPTVSLGGVDDSQPYHVNTDFHSALSRLESATESSGQTMLRHYVSSGNSSLPVPYHSTGIDDNDLATAQPIEEPNSIGLSSARRTVPSDETQYILKYQELSHDKKDVPPTDSGYDSVFHSLGLQTPSAECSSGDLVDACHGKRPDEPDSDTSYSATSVNANAQQHIAELCGNIYGRVGPYINQKNWPTINSGLADLIKSFALTLGTESTSQINRDIMYFVHKRGREIAERLTTMVAGSDLQCEVAAEPPRDKGNEMSIYEKMSLWDQNANATPPSRVSPDFFEGVIDSEDDAFDLSDLSNYNEVVLESTAFSWLVDVLIRDLSLTWDCANPEGTSSGMEIRRKISSILPSGYISKKQQPQFHEARFRFPEWTLSKRSILGGHRLTENANQDMLTYIVLAYHKTDAQAMSVKDYMMQTWPSTSRQILGLLEAIFNGTDESAHVARLPFNTTLETYIDAGVLTMTAVGAANIIAECGEQLAWFCAVYLRDERKKIVRQAPIVTAPIPKRRSKRRLKYRSNTQNETLDFDFRAEETTQGSDWAQEQWWLGILKEKLTIVQGYPILRRPEQYHGLEITSDIFLKAVGVGLGDICLKRTRRGVRLNGSKKSLVLVERTGDIFLWHHTWGIGRCPCQPPVMLPPSYDKDAQSLGLDDLTSGRHIIESCAYGMEQIGTSENNESAASDAAPIGLQSHVLGVTWDLSSSPCEESSTDGKPGIIETKSVRPASHHVRTYSSGSQSGISPYSSLDSDLLSMSDASEELEPLENDDPLKEIFKSVASQLVDGYRTAHEGETPSDSKVPNVGTSHGSQGACTTSNSPPKQRKGKRTRTDEDDSEDDVTQPRSSKRFNREPENRPFACPFWKAEQHRHQECFKFKLSRIRDVKQHLKRKHTPDDYCRRCLEIFPDDLRLQEHISQPHGFVCEPAKAGVILKGISPSQSKQLSRKSKSTLTEEEQWFAMWDIIFPEQQRPSSVYLEPEIVSEIYSFLDYCRLHSGPLLANMLAAASLPGPSMTPAMQEKRLGQIHSDGLDMMFHRWFANSSFHSASSRVSQESPLSSIQGISQQTPALSNNDSGVGLGSQATNSNVHLHDTMPHRGLPQGYHNVVGTLDGVLKSPDPFLDPKDHSNSPTFGINEGQDFDFGDINFDDFVQPAGFAMSDGN